MKQVIRVTVMGMLIFLMSCSNAPRKPKFKHPIILKTMIEKKRAEQQSCIHDLIDKEVAPLEAKEICNEIFLPAYRAK